MKSLWCWCQSYKTFLFTNDAPGNKARVFLPGKYFLPSLIFEVKAGKGVYWKYFLPSFIF
jgi:hypothetical protein